MAVDLSNFLAVAAVLVFVLFKLAAEFRDDSNLAIGCGVIATVLAGVSAAFVAIRGYAELPLLAKTWPGAMCSVRCSR